MVCSNVCLWLSTDIRVVFVWVRDPSVVAGSAYVSVDIVGFGHLGTLQASLFSLLSKFLVVIRVV